VLANALHSASVTLRRENSSSACFAKARKETVGVERIERNADDATGGDEPGVRQVQDAGNQFAAREITRRTKQHDHLRKTRTDTDRNLGHGAELRTTA
jgi:hypothetical protein